MIYLVSVIWSFAIVAFYSIGLGYWFCLVLDHHRFLKHSSGILVFVWSLCHHRLLQHKLGYWFCSVLDHHRLLQHSSGILAFFGLCVIIAFYSIDQDIGFVRFFESSSLFKAQSQNFGSCVFSRNSICWFYFQILLLCWLNIGIGKIEVD